MSRLIQICVILFSVLLEPTVLRCAESTVLVADQSDCISLQGLIECHQEYGPPGFGESPDKDIKWTAWTIALSESIKVRHWDDALKKCVDENFRNLQVIIPSGDKDKQLRGLLGKLVKISGQLHSAKAQGEITHVVIWVSAINIERK